MNRKSIYLFLIVVLGVGLVACASGNEETGNEIAQESLPEPSATAVPTETAVPPTFTPEPTVTSTATPMPTPTVERCDIIVLEDAIAALNEFDSYQSNLIMTTDAELLDGETLMEMEMVVQLEDGLVQQVAVAMHSPINERQNMEMIFAEERLYFKNPETDQWETVEGEFAIELFDSLTESQLIKPEMVNNLDLATCEVSYAEIDGVEAKLYAFSGFSLDGVPSVTGDLLAEDSDTVSGKSLVFTLLPYEGILVPVQMEMVLQFFDFDEVFDVTAVQEVHSINAPTKIAIPDVTPPSFALDIPLDETAVVLLEREEVITFALPGEPELILAEYRAFFIENGWLEGDSYEEESQGVVFQAVDFSKEYDTLTMLVGESAGSVVVVFGLEGLPRFLDVPILPDSETQDQFGSYLEYLSPLSHDEILAFYEEIMPQEGWSLKNWGREIWEEYELTYRRYVRGEVSIRITISEREEGTLVTIARE